MFCNAEHQPQMLKLFPQFANFHILIKGNSLLETVSKNRDGRGELRHIHHFLFFP